MTDNAARVDLAKMRGYVQDFPCYCFEGEECERCYVVGGFERLAAEVARRDEQLADVVPGIRTWIDESGHRAGCDAVGIWDWFDSLRPPKGPCSCGHAAALSGLAALAALAADGGGATKTFCGDENCDGVSCAE